MKIAFVFPGQGSQSVGMMKGFDGHPAVRAAFDEASSVLGEDLWTLASAGPEEALDLTVNTQPVMLTAAVAVWRAWQAAGGPAPAIVAGHSLGEYSALVAAGALAFRDAVPLVRFRAQAMQEAVPPGAGAMAAILGADDDTVAAACRQAAEGHVVEPVNYNAPAQVVIAGERAAVERAMLAAKELGARRAVLLPVSAPFHSSLLKPAAERLAQRLAQVPVAAPSIPVLHNVDVALHPEPDAIRAALARQAASPVRWTQTIRAFAEAGVTHVVECGPGKVLANLVKRIDERLEPLALTSGSMLDDALAQLKG
ncbi:MAG: malonyl CoA-acyl carrier protein transacylase [Betaproteobacteria bacterium]|nr:MAG: malonyl CoA-acyl carrier protein transacylase [Betaproteobacteria bacterium]